MTKYLLKIFLLFTSLLVLHVQAANIYRYSDDSGNIILGSRVLAEYVKNGYEILNERGQLIETVSRTLSGDELAAQSEILEQQRLAEAARLQLEEDDRLLLFLYRSPEEVIRRHDSTLEELEGQFSVLSALLEDAQEKVVELQQRTANFETAGGEVPANLLSQIEGASEERDRLNRQILRISTEKDKTLTEAEININRLKELLNLN